MKSIGFLADALMQAKKAFEKQEVPIGAVVVKDGTIIAASHNLTETQHDSTAHAEALAIRSACKALGQKYLLDCDLYVTLEPCAMCAGAISLAKIRRLYFGAYDPKSGGVEHGARVFSQTTCHHKPEVYGGIMEEECGELLKLFFVEKR